MSLFDKTKASLTNIIASDVQLNELNSNSFGGLIYLLIVDLSNNKLKFLPAEVISETTQIRDLYLRNNEIQSIDVDAFKGLQTLDTLDLSQNQLHQINHGTLNQLTSLGNLNLSGNSLEMHYGMFPRSLVSLDLSYNNIENFSLKFITSLRNLKKLFVNGNGMNYNREFIFPNNIFKGLSALEKIELSENKFSCHELSNIYIHLRSNDITTDVPAHLAVYNRSNIAGIECLE
jgi:Leucine-rich repeat (LRR) protein